MHISDLNEKHTGLTLVGSPTLGSLLALGEEPLGIHANANRFQSKPCIKAARTAWKRL